MRIENLEILISHFSSLIYRDFLHFNQNHRTVLRDCSFLGIYLFQLMVLQAGTPTTRPRNFSL